MELDTILDDAMEEQELSFNSETRAALLEAARWARVFSIVGLALASILIITIIYGAAQSRSVSFIFGSGAEGIIFGTIVVIAIIFFFLVFFLFQFANLVQSGFKQKNTYQLELAFQNLRFYFVLIGGLLVFFSVLALIGTIGRL